MNPILDPSFLLYFWIIMLGIGILSGIAILIHSIILAKKGNSIPLKYNLLTFLFILIAIASWGFNMGWLRLFMTFLAIPIIHTSVFMILNHFSLSYINQSSYLKKLVIFSNIAYLIGYLLLPDLGDIGPMYLFFGLIRNNLIATFGYEISAVGFLATVVLLILQIIECRKIKKQHKMNNITVPKI